LDFAESVYFDGVIPTDLALVVAFVKRWVAGDVGNDGTGFELANHVLPHYAVRSVGDWMIVAIKTGLYERNAGEALRQGLELDVVQPVI
jgi:hypothetical protein